MAQVRLHVLKRGPGKEGIVKSGQPVVDQENANRTRATCSRDHEKRGLSTDMERKKKEKKRKERPAMGEEEGEVFELENAETEEGDEEEKKSSLFLPLSLQPCDGMHSSRLLLAGGRLVFLRVKGDESDGEIPLPLRLYGGGGLERSARSPALGHILRRGGPTSHGDVSIELIRTESTRSPRVTPLNAPRAPESKPTLLDPN